MVQHLPPWFMSLNGVVSGLVAVHIVVNHLHQGTELALGVSFVDGTHHVVRDATVLPWLQGLLHKTMHILV
jgi:hypothetical protein